MKNHCGSEGALRFAPQGNEVSDNEIGVQNIHRFRQKLIRFTEGVSLALKRWALHFWFSIYTASEALPRRTKDRIMTTISQEALDCLPAHSSEPPTRVESSGASWARNRTLFVTYVVATSRLLQAH